MRKTLSLSIASLTRNISNVKPGARVTSRRGRDDRYGPKCSGCHPVLCRLDTDPVQLDMGINATNQGPFLLLLVSLHSLGAHRGLDDPGKIFAPVRVPFISGNPALMHQA